MYQKCRYYAAALSLVLHTRSPKVPTFRADVRYFELADGSGWFGGGSDLTPYILYDDDIRDFHKCLKSTCDKHSSALYPQMKKACDEYFFIPAREEHRGTGGIFFDDLDGTDFSGEGSLDQAMCELIAFLTMMNFICLYTQTTDFFID